MFFVFSLLPILCSLVCSFSRPARRAPGTLANYHSKFTLLGQALLDLGNHDAVDGVTKLPKIPMTEEAALAGIQQMTKTRNGKTAAYSTVNSAVVALRFYHEEAGKPVPAELAKKLRSLLEGVVGWCLMRPDECGCCAGRGAGAGGSLVHVFLR